jgi:drug/metabolite transporter (DMT)-like permease
LRRQPNRRSSGWFPALDTWICKGPIIIDRKLGGVPPMGVVTASLIVAALLYAPFAPFCWPARITPAAAWSVLALAVFCTAIAFLLFFALIAEAGPARATVITYINPAVALLLGVLVLHEPLTIGMAIGFPLVILGSILGTSKSPKEATRELACENMVH